MNNNSFKISLKDYLLEFKKAFESFVQTLGTANPEKVCVHEI